MSPACAYYNDNDEFVAAWLRSLIKANLLPPGDVDERDIRDVEASDLKGYTQAHFFAGIGGWPLALKLAGWPKTREVWTGSCPCQPFSEADSKRRGYADERHLWPEWFPLIRERRPPVIFGEQVPQAISLGWFDDVANDLEGCGYAIGAAVLSACAVEARQERERLWRRRRRFRTR
jgi:DNA (cytosine-5)-methyltransferase 1